MSLILCIETSTNVCSVAISKHNEIIDSRINVDGNTHAELLTVYISELLKNNNISATNLDAVAVSMGPGSYTGLRIGVSTAKGLCYGLNKPLIAINTLQMMAHGLMTDLNEQNIDIDTVWFAPMIDARRMEVYTAFFDKGNNQTSEISAKIIDETSFSDILNERNIYFFGNGAEKCKESITHSNALFVDGVVPNAEYMVQLAERAFLDEEFVDVAYFEPFYLKEFIATTPKKNLLEETRRPKQGIKGQRHRGTK